MICLREICVQCEKCHLHNDTWIYFHMAESFRRRESGKEFIYFGQAFAIQKKIFFGSWASSPVECKSAMAIFILA